MLFRSGVAYVAEAKKLVPGKPLRYVWNSHPHADHTGGLPALVAEGVTIVTQKNNVKFLEDALNTPRTLLDDVLAKSPKKVKIEGIDKKKVFTDGTRTIELHTLQNLPHAGDLMVVYLPKEKILFNADLYSPPAAGAAAPAPNVSARTLQANIVKLKLDVQKHVPAHGRVGTGAEFNAMFAGATKTQ